MNIRLSSKPLEATNYHHDRQYHANHASVDASGDEHVCNIRRTVSRQLIWKPVRRVTRSRQPPCAEMFDGLVDQVSSMISSPSNQVTDAANEKPYGRLHKELKPDEHTNNTPAYSPRLSAQGPTGQCQKTERESEEGPAGTCGDHDEY